MYIFFWFLFKHKLVFNWNYKHMLFTRSPIQTIYGHKIKTVYGYKYFRMWLDTIFSVPDYEFIVWFYAQ